MVQFYDWILLSKIGYYEWDISWNSDVSSMWLRRYLISATEMTNGKWINLGTILLLNSIIQDWILRMRYLLNSDVSSMWLRRYLLSATECQMKMSKPRYNSIIQDWILRLRMRYLLKFWCIFNVIEEISPLGDRMPNENE